MPEKRPTICILGATFTTANMGVSALAAGTITCLLHRFPNAKLFFLDYDKKAFTHLFQLGNRSVSVEFVNMRFSKRVYLANNIAFLLLISLALKVVPLRRLRDRLTRTNRCLRWLWQADLVVSMAGGDSFSDIYGTERFLYGVLPQVLALFMGRRLVLLPQTLGPFCGRLTKLLAQYVLKGAETVYSRDHWGGRNTEELLAADSGRVRFGYDLGFAVDARPPLSLGWVGQPLRSSGAVVVGLNVSGLLYIGGYTRDNMFGLRVDYRLLIRHVIDLFVEQKEAIILLVPHVFGTSEESDATVCERLYEELKPVYGSKIAYAGGPHEVSEIKYIIGACDFFVGSRMHACIAAVSQEVPAVAISYSDKFIGVMETVGIESLVADARKMDERAILQFVAEAYEQRNAMRQTLAREMPRVKRQVLELFSDFNLPGTGGCDGTLPADAQPPVEEGN